MPSKQVLEEKKALVEGLKKKIGAAPAGVIVDYQGISVADDTKLRRELREAGVEYKVVKNTMLNLAVSELGFKEMEKSLHGTTAIALSGEDEIAPARILGKYAAASKGKFTIKAGYIDGQEMDAAAVVELSKLPGREGLLSMLCSALSGNLRGLAVALNRVVEQKGSGDVA